MKVLMGWGVGGQGTGFWAGPKEVTTPTFREVILIAILRQQSYHWGEKN